MSFDPGGNISKDQFSAQSQAMPLFSNDHNNGGEVRTKHYASRGHTAVLIPSCIIILPMLLFPAILLGVVFHYRISGSAPLFPSLASPSAGLDQDAYYVDMSATTIATIASWSSSVALSLVGFAMALWTYSISSSVLAQTHGTRYTELPTPFQFALLLKLVSGGMSPLWDVFSYGWGWSKKRSKISPVVFRTTLVLAIGIVLSILIILADQWLHLATKSVIIPQIYPSAHYSSSGKRLAESCINDIQEGEDPGTSYPCTIVVTALQEVLTNASIAYATVNNVSTTSRAELITQDSSTYAILSDPSTDPSLDYSTSTYGVSSTCKPIGAQCDFQQQMGDAVNFNCAPINFKGQSLAAIGMQKYVLSFFENAAGTKNATATSFVNPFYFALAVNIDSVDEYPDAPDYMGDDPNVIVPDHGLTTVLWCDVSVYDIAYSRVNGSIVSLAPEMSNGTLGGMVLATMKYQFEINKWMESLRMAAFANDSQAMADQFAVTVSQTGVALISGQLSPQENSEEQVRLNVIVARVPTAPLYFVVILCLLYCLFGVVLGAAAFYLSRRQDVRELQIRLGIPALVAEAFERERTGSQVDVVEELFSEWNGEQGRLIGAKRSEKGGLRFEAL
ncbi:hypothetical protein N431DRAFT_489274 [Stipitochalara longipes BDJ]|nr:hypothetical protein N431DRAFT_489274 [Stipitochalara longipes BDJ]